MRGVRFIHRDFLVEKNGNYVLTGPRRAGKTYALYQIAHKKIADGAVPEEILYINFEDERLIEAGTDFQPDFCPLTRKKPAH
jgi:predicted AAA+ superfamily ATPase